MFTLDLYREGDEWFFDDIKKDIEHEGLVDGIPEIIYAMVGSDQITKCKVSVNTKDPSLSPTKNSSWLEMALEDEVDPMGGVYYSYEGIKGWLCPVFWRYFTPPDAPPKLWVLIGDAV